MDSPLLFGGRPAQARWANLKLDLLDHVLKYKIVILQPIAKILLNKKHNKQKKMPLKKDDEVEIHNRINRTNFPEILKIPEKWKIIFWKKLILILDIFRKFEISIFDGNTIFLEFWTYLISWKLKSSIFSWFSGCMCQMHVTNVRRS